MFLSSELFSTPGADGTFDILKWADSDNNDIDLDDLNLDFMEEEKAGGQATDLKKEDLPENIPEK